MPVKKIALRLLPLAVIISLIGVGLYFYPAKAVPKFSQTTAVRNCHQASSDRQPECWSNLIDQSIQTRGLLPTFTLLTSLYDQEPNFAASCHALTHLIGRRTYEVWLRKQPIKVTSDVSQCGYGFYHGFMETLAARNGSMTQARLFCLKVDQDLSGLGSKESISCFHGIGHGVVTPHDQSLWGYPEKMLPPALLLCGQAADTDKRRADCQNGVYSGLATLTANDEYKLKINRESPLWICPTQPEDLQASCYSGMVIILSKITSNNFPQAAEYIKKIPNPNIAKTMIKLMTGPVIYADPKRTDFTQAILDCHNLPAELKDPCLKGLANGIAEFHGPKDGPLAALSFCQTSTMTKVETDECFQDIMFSLNDSQKQKVRGELCHATNPAYQKYCE